MPKVKQFDKSKVLREAANIFRQKGYNGTSIDEILKATGLSRSSLYDSFHDKHSLYLQALEIYKQSENESMQEVHKKELNGLEKIELVFNEVVNHLVEHPDDNGCLMVNAAAEMSKHCDKTAQVVCNNKEDAQKLFASWMEDARKKGLVKLNKPMDYYGQFLFNTLCGLKVMSQSGADKEELSNVVKVTLAALN
ncbi:MAG TPA: TetR/AcrR family transcriptional regulator [Bacteroidia bacterium]|nr:TetR/AcrR family transcriptional regulator [Bacteroidia bacterium]